MEKGKLFVVATPIGNLEDVTFRALETLKTASLIACEDTRVTQKLLDRYKISNRLVSYHKFNEKERVRLILSEIEKGNSVALVSDAGTPCVCDPGKILVTELSSLGAEIIPIPGACAITALLSAIPKSDEVFKFVGFLPRTKTQQEETFRQNKHTDMVFYESANRLLKTLEVISETRGPGTKIAIARELTKVFEEIQIDTAENTIAYYKNNTLKGEIVALLYADENSDLEDSALQEKIDKLKRQNFSDKDISIIISELFDINKNKVYKQTIKH